MGFQTPQYGLKEYMDRVTSGEYQLPDFQREFKWDENRIRDLLVTVLRGHPMGVLMLLDTGNNHIRFKPRPIEGVTLKDTVEPEALILDGQQRLTSLTQALTGDGVVHTQDSRGKLLSRKYFVHIETALLGEEAMSDAVHIVPADGKLWAPFGRDLQLDISTPEKARVEGYIPVTMLTEKVQTLSWLAELPDKELMLRVLDEIVTPFSSYKIPAIRLDKNTTKSAVTTVFEKVNTGGLALNVFELLTATFAGDKAHYDEHGTDFRLSDDWKLTKKEFEGYPALGSVKNTDFLQAVSLLTSWSRSQEQPNRRVTARRDDLLQLELSDYLKWVDPLRKAFKWVARYLADHHIFEKKFVPYPTQLVPLAVIRVILGAKADRHGVRDRIDQWFWCGILGESYGSSTETRFSRDVEQVPSWALGETQSVPKTVTDCQIHDSRFTSLRTRRSAAYKGIYALLMSKGATDWMNRQQFGAVQYSDLAVDIHHVFPSQWIKNHAPESELANSILNKTALSASTNRSIGGAAPSKYLTKIARDSNQTESQVDHVVESHFINPKFLRNDDFEGFLRDRLKQLTELVETATGRAVQRDTGTDFTGSEGPAAFATDEPTSGSDAFAEGLEESY